MSGRVENRIRAIALDIGFSLVGIAPVIPHERSNRVFARWIEDGQHGDMNYLSRHQPLREDINRILEGARSAICVAVNYYQPAEKEQRSMNGSDNRGAFSVYVHGRDYHQVISEMLSELEVRLRNEFPEMRAQQCVDTKPISDRTMAMRAGIAWLGKNSSVISPQFGSWIFLGQLITDLSLEPDEPLETLCGSCTRCIDACPTGALDTPFTLDARKCISYLTIEKRGDIPGELHQAIGLDVYGCDTCQSVCPFNDVATVSTVFDREQRSPLVDYTLDQLVAISDDDFHELTRDSAISRCKPEGIRRNAAIVRDNIANGPVSQPAASFTNPGE